MAELRNFENHVHDGHFGFVLQARDVYGGVTVHPSESRERAMPRELPADIRGFVGREEELQLLQAVESTSDAPRIELITGTAGVGKTALAIHFAHRVRDRYRDGELFVNLRGFDPNPPLTASAALERFLRSLGVPSAAIPDDPEERSALFRSTTADTRLLIIADNASSVEQVRPLIPAGRGNLLVVTSRKRLSGLSSHSSTRRVALGLLPPDQSAALITSVLRDCRSEDDPARIADLAKLCANLPLALRIAAERAAARPKMPLGELVEDLRAEASRWQALTADDERDAEAVRTVFTWSYRALPAPAARCFRLLALHPGLDFGLDVAGAILGEPVDRARALLDVLTGAHLIEQTGPRRFQFHDLLRAYASDQVELDDTPNTRPLAIQRAATWYLHGARAVVSATGRLFASDLPDQSASESSPRFENDEDARAWFAQERANLLAALEAAHGCELDELTCDLADTLSPVYAAASAIDDWRRGGGLGLESADRSGDAVARARMLSMLASADHATGNFESAIARFQQAAAVYEAAGARELQVRTVNSIGLIHLARRDLDQALVCFADTLDRADGAGLKVWSAIARDNLAATHKQAGRLDPAAALAHQAIEAYQAVGVDAWILAVPLLHLARIHRETGRFELAEQYLARAEKAVPNPDAYLSVACDILLERAALDEALGNAERANDAYWQCVRIQRPLGHRAREAAAYSGLGRILARKGQSGAASEYHYQALALRRELPDPYLLASTLADLAVTLEACAARQQAEACRAEAYELLEEVNDPRSAQLRDTIAALLTRTA